MNALEDDHMKEAGMSEAELGRRGEDWRAVLGQLHAEVLEEQSPRGTLGIRASLAQLEAWQW